MLHHSACCILLSQGIYIIHSNYRLRSNFQHVMLIWVTIFVITKVDTVAFTNIKSYLIYLRPTIYLIHICNFLEPII